MKLAATAALSGAVRARFGPRSAHGSPAGSSPDLAVINGRVYTSDPRQPRASAFAVHNGRFVAVGQTQDVQNLCTAATSVIDAEGRTVTAGFIDAHSHPASAGLAELIHVDCDLRNIQKIQQALRKRADQTPEDMWVTGVKYDDTKLAEGRGITRHDLDQAVSDRVVRVHHRGGHTAVFNSLAFELAGVDRNTPDPPDGRFDRDDQGELTGLVQEAARNAFARVPRRHPQITAETHRDGVALISKQMSAKGLTTVHDASAQSITPYHDAYAEGLVRCRFYLMMTGGLYKRVKDAGLRTGFGNDWLRIGGLKLFADGSASERTMRMSTPYEGRPEDYGILMTSQDRLDEIVGEAHRNGFQVGVHANGDVAIDMVLKAYEKAVRSHPRARPRHRIEHCSLVDHQLLLRMRALGVIPTPFYTYVYYHGRKWLHYGKQRMERMFAHRWFLDYGIPVAGASDYMPGPYDPMMAIQSMVTRTDFEGRVWGPNQRITVDEALRVCTLNGAYASFEEDSKGSITDGKLADFVILNDDPHDVDPHRIKDIPVDQVVVGGRTVFLR